MMRRRLFLSPTQMLLAGFSDKRGDVPRRAPSFLGKYVPGQAGSGGLTSPPLKPLPASLSPLPLPPEYTPFPLPRHDETFGYGPVRARGAADVTAARLRTAATELPDPAVFESDEMLQFMLALHQGEEAAKPKGGDENGSQTNDGAGEGPAAAQSVAMDTYERAEREVQQSLLRAKGEIARAAADHIARRRRAHLEQREALGRPTILTEDETYSGAGAKEIEQHTHTESPFERKSHPEKALSLPQLYIADPAGGGSPHFQRPMCLIPIPVLLYQYLASVASGAAGDIAHAAALADLSHAIPGLLNGQGVGATVQMEQGNQILTVRRGGALLRMLLDTISSQLHPSQPAGAMIARGHQSLNFGGEARPKARPFPMLINAYTALFDTLEEALLESRDCGADIPEAGQAGKVNSSGNVATVDTLGPRASTERPPLQDVRTLQSLFNFYASLRVLDFNSWYTVTERERSFNGTVARLPGGASTFSRQGVGQRLYAAMLDSATGAEYAPPLDISGFVDSGLRGLLGEAAQACIDEASSASDSLGRIGAALWAREQQLRQAVLTSTGLEEEAAKGQLGRITDYRRTKLAEHWAAISPIAYQLRYELPPSAATDLLAALYRSHPSNHIMNSTGNNQNNATAPDIPVAAVHGLLSAVFDLGRPDGGVASMLAAEIDADGVQGRPAMTLTDVEQLQLVVAAGGANDARAMLLPALRLHLVRQQYKRLNAGADTAKGNAHLLSLVGKRVPLPGADAEGSPRVKVLTGISSRDFLGPEGLDALVRCAQEIAPVMKAIENRDMSIKSAMALLEHANGLSVLDDFKLACIGDGSEAAQSPAQGDPCPRALTAGHTAELAFDLIISEVTRSVRGAVSMAQAMEHVVTGLAAKQGDAGTATGDDEADSLTHKHELALLKLERFTSSILTSACHLIACLPPSRGAALALSLDIDTLLLRFSVPHAGLMLTKAGYNSCDAPSDGSGDAPQRRLLIEDFSSHEREATAVADPGSRRRLPAFSGGVFAAADVNFFKSLFVEGDNGAEAAPRMRRFSAATIPHSTIARRPLNPLIGALRRCRGLGSEGMIVSTSTLLALEELSCTHPKKMVRDRAVKAVYMLLTAALTGRPYAPHSRNAGSHGNVFIVPYSCELLLRGGIVDETKLAKALDGIDVHHIDPADMVRLVNSVTLEEGEAGGAMPQETTITWLTHRALRHANPSAMVQIIADTRDTEVAKPEISLNRKGAGVILAPDEELMLLQLKQRQLPLGYHKGNEIGAESAGKNSRLAIGAYFNSPLNGLVGDSPFMFSTGKKPNNNLNAGSGSKFAKVLMRMRSWGRDSMGAAPVWDSRYTAHAAGDFSYARMSRQGQKVGGIREHVRLTGSERFGYGYLANARNADIGGLGIYAPDFPMVDRRIVPSKCDAQKRIRRRHSPAASGEASPSRSKPHFTGLNKELAQYHSGNPNALLMPAELKRWLWRRNRQADAEALAEACLQQEAKQASS